MIKYECMPNGNIKVRLNGRTTGEIMGCQEKGFYYKAYGSKFNGEVFKTIREVKKSLEN